LTAVYTSYHDGELVDFLRSSDHDAFTEIYDRYHTGVYNYLLGFVKNPVQAEDLVHEVFIKVWEIRERLHIEASFGAYLYRICHNMAVSALKEIARDRRSREKAISYFRAIAITEPSLPGELKQYDLLLQQALDSLPPQRRKIFILCRQEGKTYDQTAAELGLSRNTVKEHMIKALRDLRAYLADKGEIALAILIIEHLF
jgi:RNA polymerase sigma-70 factor (family 1)